MSADKITLQVNTSGSWRNVIEFDAERRARVVLALHMLSRELGGARFCLLLPDGKREWLKD
jgi:hypothetical protein